MKEILEINVAYWHSRYFDLPYEHNQYFPYSMRKRNAIINKILSKGYSVMLRPSMGDNGQTLIIWIDKGRFGQS